MKETICIKDCLFGYTEERINNQFVEWQIEDLTKDCGNHDLITINSDETYTNWKRYTLSEEEIRQDGERFFTGSELEEYVQDQLERQNKFPKLSDDSVWIEKEIRSDLYLSYMARQVSTKKHIVQKKDHITYEKYKEYDQLNNYDISVWISRTTAICINWKFSWDFQADRKDPIFNKEESNLNAVCLKCTKKYNKFEDTYKKLLEDDKNIYWKHIHRV